MTRWRWIRSLFDLHDDGSRHDWARLDRKVGRHRCEWDYCRCLWMACKRCQAERVHSFGSDEIR